MRSPLVAIRRILQRRKGRAGKRPSVPDRLRIYAIGDIHGRVDLLERLHCRIRDDAANTTEDLRKTVIYLGDYIDRGLKSREVINLLLQSPLEGFEAVHLKGNHDDLLLRFLADPSLGPDWFAIGGDATAMSYGVRIPKGLSAAQRFEHVRDELLSRIPAPHLEFLSRLPLIYQAGAYVFVHAGIRPGIPLDRQNPQDLLWIRDGFLDRRDHGGKVIVHGHSMSDRPEIHDHRIGIDTAAYATNTLTCLVLEGETRRFLSTAEVGAG